MRNNALVVTFCALSLTCACGRKNEEPSQPAATALSAPASMVTGPALRSSSTYTNEMQAKYLQNQAAELGIQRFAPANQAAGESETAPPGVSYAEGLARTRELERSLSAQRRRIDRDKPKSIDLPGNTPMLLQTPTDAAGAPASPSTTP